MEMSAIIRVLASAALAFAPVGVESGEPDPLFASDDVISVTLTAPINEIARNAPRSMEAHAALLTLHGERTEEHAIMLSARGKSRRDKSVCHFPPLRVEFVEKPGEDSFFDGQKRLKLVTHCKSSKRYQQYYLREYAAYKLFNVLTPLSLKVRLARIDYIDSDKNKLVISRLGFFIEDADDAAKRNGLKEIDTPDIISDQLNPEAAARYTVFQYMIGNLDWSMIDGPEGDDCCHNTKLLGNDAKPYADLAPVPYDFDYSGFVNAPYALPPEGVDVHSVRKRYYRGLCKHNQEALKQAQRFLESRDALMRTVETVAEMGEREKRATLRYLDVFFKDIADDERVRRRLLKTCRD